MIGDYTVTYHTMLPAMVKSNLGEVIVSENKPGGKSYVASDLKLVRLKKSPKDQGPYPSVSNAAIQITKLEISKKTSMEKLYKKIKKLTKIYKKKDESNQALPVIIYPYRLTEKI